MPRGMCRERMASIREIAPAAAHRPAPAPVSPRLLAGDDALFANQGGDPPLGQEQRCADADNPAADDRHVDPPRKRLGGSNEIDDRHRQMISSGTSPPPTSISIPASVRA